MDAQEIFFISLMVAVVLMSGFVSLLILVRLLKAENR